MLFISFILSCGQGSSSCSATDHHKLSLVGFSFSSTVLFAVLAACLLEVIGPLCPLLSQFSMLRLICFTGGVEFYAERVFESVQLVRQHAGEVLRCLEHSLRVQHRGYIRHVFGYRAYSHLTK